MKNIMVVLATFAVLVGVSAHKKTLASDAGTTDDASINDASSNDAQSPQVEEAVEETVEEIEPYEPIIDNRPPPSTEEYVPPETAGTITCSGKGANVKVEIKGNLMIGLTTLLPLKMMRRISLTKEGRTCWGSSLWSGCTLTQAICVKVNKYDLICQPPSDVHVVFRNVPAMSFIPQIGGYGSFDLKRWQVIGCIREGCDGVCHTGEKCRHGPTCTINTR